MYKKLSFDSEASNCSSDIEEIETKEQTHDEEVQKKFPNINLIKAIAQTLETILEDNKNRPNYKDVVKKQSSMVFSSNNVPSISIENYLKRIQTYSTQSQEMGVTRTEPLMSQMPMLVLQLVVL